VSGAAYSNGERLTLSLAECIPSHFGRSPAIRGVSAEADEGIVERLGQEPGLEAVGSWRSLPLGPMSSAPPSCFNSSSRVSGCWREAAVVPRQCQGRQRHPARETS